MGVGLLRRLLTSVRSRSRVAARRAVSGEAPLPVSLIESGSLSRRLGLCRPVDPAGSLAFTLHRHLGQISPNKNVNFRRTSSPSTRRPLGIGFARPRAAHLGTPSLNDVSVRSLAALVPVSFPRSVPLPRPTSGRCPLSPRTLSIGEIIWYADLLETPNSYTGLSPDKITPMTGVHNRFNRSRGPRGF